MSARESLPSQAIHPCDPLPLKPPSGLFDLIFGRRQRRQEVDPRLRPTGPEGLWVLGGAALALSKKEWSRRSAGLSAARDAVHWMPRFLKLTHPEDTDFCCQAFERLPELLEPENPFFLPFRVTPGQRARVHGVASLGAEPIAEGDFEQAERGDVVAALRIARALLWLDRDRFGK